MPKIKLFGITSSTASFYSTGLHIGSVFTCTYDGMATDIQVESALSGNVKLNLYEGNDASATLLSALNSDNSCSTGSNRFALSSPVLVSSSTDYFIGATADTSGGVIGASLSSPNSTRLLKSATYSTFTAPSDLTGYSSSSTFSASYSIWGWQEPIIVSIDDDEILNGQTGITLTGTDFMDSGATLELCNNSDYSLATVKLSQSITDQSDTSVEFTLNNNSQLWGINYLFITTSIGQVTAVGQSVNVGRTVYVFVTNDQGYRNSVGYPITLFE